MSKGKKIFYQMEYFSFSKMRNCYQKPLSKAIIYVNI